MKLTEIGSAFVSTITSRLLRRAALVAAGGLFALAALYHTTVAGTVALELQVGALYARLIIAGVYALAAGITVAVFFVTRSMPSNGKNDALDQLRAQATGDLKLVQLAMIVEAVLLGYALSRRSGRSGR